MIKSAFVAYIRNHVCWKLSV